MLNEAEVDRDLASDADRRCIVCTKCCDRYGKGHAIQAASPSEIVTCEKVKIALK